MGVGTNVARLCRSLVVGSPEQEQLMGDTLLSSCPYYVAQARDRQTFICLTVIEAQCNRVICVESKLTSDSPIYSAIDSKFWEMGLEEKVL